MNITFQKQIIELIKREVVPAIGCTEPMAVALASAKASEVLGKTPQRIEVFLSANVLKNAMGVGIPGTGMIGLPIAIALGALIGKSAYGLEVLRDVDSESLTNGKALIEKKCIQISLKEQVDKLYIEVICHYEEEFAKVIITKEHTHIVYIEKNNNVLLDQQIDDSSENRKEEECNLTFASVYEFATEATIDDIQFILQSAELNRQAAISSAQGNFGHSVCKTVTGVNGKRFLGDSALTHMLAMTSAACDVRMDGA